MLSSPLHSSPLQTIKSSLSASSTAMKDRPPPSSHCAVYVPPHCRLRSLVFTPYCHSSSTAPSPPINSKIRYNHSESIAVLSPRNCPLQQQQRKGVAVAVNNKNGNKKLAPMLISKLVLCQVFLKLVVIWDFFL